MLLLTQNGVDFGIKGKIGHTALRWAAVNGHEDVVRLLQAMAGIDLKYKDHRAEHG
jgi:ankyrin repeat protein